MIGFGSIGTRHAEIISKLGYSISAVTSRTDLSISTYAKTSQVKNINDFQYAVISSGTSEHSEDLTELIRLGFEGKVLVEKPLNLSVSNFLNENEIFVGYNLRFLSGFQELRKRISEQTVLNVDAYAGSDFKTWRETQNRPISYSAFKAKGGGVLHDLSHEIDYLTWAFGKLNLVFAKGGRYSNVTHDSDDAWDIICESANVPKISIRLNYLDKSNTRQLRVITDVETHVFDLLNNSISSSTSGEYFGGNKIADTYREMHLAILSGEGSESISTFVQGLEVDRFISACINFNSGANR